MENQIDNNIEELKRNNKYKDEIIDSCLKFIDELLPAYMNEKNHIIMGEDWELNRSIHVMIQIRNRLIGCVGDEKRLKADKDCLNKLYELQQNYISSVDNWDNLKRWLEKENEDDGMYILPISIDDILKKMEELENGSRRY